MRALEICIISVLSTGLLFAGILDSTRVVEPHSGSQALEFGLSGLFNYSSYIGNSISVKKFKTPYKARRVSLYISVDGYNESGPIEELSYNYNPNDSTVNVSDFDKTSQLRNNDLTLSVQGIRYAKPYNNLSLLIGIGPILGMDLHRSEYKSVSDSPSSGLAHVENRETTNIIYSGLMPVVGVEWFMHKNFSFHAEYYTTLKLGWRFEEDYEKVKYTTGNWRVKNSDLSGLYYNARGYAQGGVSFFFK